MKRASLVAGLVVIGLASVGTVIHGQVSKLPGNIWPPARKATPTSPALTPEEEMKTFSMPPGYHAQLVASEPLVNSPILIDFDADGRLWVLEMQGFLPDMSGRDSHDPLCDVVVLEDTNHDGVMDKRTVFVDGLDLPRAMKVLDHGVLVGEPPNLWLMKDTNGDLKMDTKEAISTTYGRGGIGIEHNANGLMWDMDNVMYTSETDQNIRYKNGKFEVVPSLSRGQWQGTQDDAGRFWRNVNDSPLFVDYTQPRYFLRNPSMGRTRGLYESVIDQLAATLYPVRPNRGVNRGYRDPFFRADDSSIVIQGAGSPTVYRGDKYPANPPGVLESVFITDSPTNLVHRFNIVDDGTGKLKAKNTYPRGEFLASSDERFRPVNLFSGPDGDMYVIDMYRGVVQDGGIWSDYLRDYIGKHDLQLPVAKGRIWRMVYGAGTPAAEQPSLSSATPEQLVGHLSDKNGWWRDTAQRLLVERNATSVAPLLKDLAGKPTTNWKTKLHALWTLDGIDAIDQPTIQKALTDPNDNVRAAAVRISERWLGDAADPMAASILELMNDKSWNVRRQVAASIGELPIAARIDPATTMLAKYGADPIIVDAVISGLAGHEAEVLDAVLQAKMPARAPAKKTAATSAAQSDVVLAQAPRTAPVAPKAGGAKARAAAAPAVPSDAVTALAATITRSGKVPDIQHLVDMATGTEDAAWQRLALLKGIDAVLPAGGGGRGRGGNGIQLAGLSTPGAGDSFTPGRGVTLPAEPTALMKVAAGTGELAMTAKSVANKFDWPGRPAPVVIVAPLTPDQQKLYATGATVFKTICASCHQADGRGKDKVAANLVDSKWVNGTDVASLIRTLLNGKEGSIGLMPPVGQTLNDEQIAGALTYIRREWGHTGSPVSPLEVTEIRGLSKDRNRPWTDEELTAAGARGGRGGGRGGPGGAAGRGGRAGGGAAGPEAPEGGR